MARATPEIRGLKFPDEFVVRHFFKSGLDRMPGSVLELGCGSGSNLALYQAFGWRVTGVDMHRPALEDARWNLGDEAVLIEADLEEGLPGSVAGPFQAVLLANVYCYLPAAAGERLLDQLRPKLSPGCAVFLRTRLIDDYRCGRGDEEEPHGYRLTISETGEAGAFNRFYTGDELETLLRQRLGIDSPVTLRCKFDNLQSGRRIEGNSDIILWGRTAA